jgi:peptidoglycan/LPS O-acetylase OafA/YrhL
LKNEDSRLPFLDLLRVLASQVIVWHHLAFYGPLSDSARDVASVLIDGLARHARLAVQVFFVVSGYLTAVGLHKREPTGFRQVRALIGARYRRIGLPYLGALGLAIAANELARHWMAHPSISARPTVGQLFAHVFLVHDLVGYEPLSAGIWYLAIELQLTALVASVFWLSARLSGLRGPVWGRAVLLALGVSSLFWFNREPELDRVAIYFIGAYGLGLCAAWARAGEVRRPFFWLYSLLLVLAISIDFRSRLLVALVTGLVLVLGEHFGWTARWPRSPLIRWLAGISYSLFLVHFPVSLVVNAFWSSHVRVTPWLSVLGMAAAYALSMLASVIFHYEIERRLVRLGRPPEPRRETRVLLEGDPLSDR